MSLPKPTEKFKRGGNYFLKNFSNFSKFITLGSSQ